MLELVSFILSVIKQREQIIWTRHIRIFQLVTEQI